MGTKLFELGKGTLYIGGPDGKLHSFAGVDGIEYTEEPESIDICGDTITPIVQQCTREITLTVELPASCRNRLRRLFDPVAAAIHRKFARVRRWRRK